MSFYDILEIGNVDKIAKRLEKEKDNIAGLLNTPYPGELRIQKLGWVCRLNVPQYLICKIILSRDRKLQDKEGSQNEEYYHMILTAILKKAAKEVLNYEDSKGNNLLHYLAVLGEHEAAKTVIGKNTKITKNTEGKVAYAICSDPETKKLLHSYMKKYNHKHGNSKHANKDSTKNKVKELPKEDGVSLKTSLKGDDKASINFYEMNATESKMSPKEDVQMDCSLPTSEKGLGKLEEASKPKVFHLGANNPSRVRKAYEKLTEEVKIRKYPGRLYLVLDKVVDLDYTDENVESIFLTVKKDAWLSTTSAYSCRPKKDVEIKETVCMSLAREKTKVDVEMYTKSKSYNGFMGLASESSKKIGGFSIFMDGGIISKCHNNIIKLKYELETNSFNGIYGMFRGMFRPSKASIRHLVMYMIYISEDEIKQVEAPEPEDMKSLKMWIKTQKAMTYMWFRGFVNIKGEGGAATTRLWKRRLLKWQGMHLVVYNEYNGSVLGDINMYFLKGFCVDNSEKKAFGNYLKLTFEKEVVEISFENTEIFNRFIGSLNHFVEL